MMTTCRHTKVLRSSLGASTPSSYTCYAPQQTKERADRAPEHVLEQVYRPVALLWEDAARIKRRVYVVLQSGEARQYTRARVRARAPVSTTAPWCARLAELFVRRQRDARQRHRRSDVLVERLGRPGRRGGARSLAVRVRVRRMRRLHRCRRGRAFVRVRLRMIGDMIGG